MEQTSFRVGKKFVRGDRKGKRITETINIKGDGNIHKFLWDATDLYERNRCNYIIEWYVLK